MKHTPGPWIKAIVAESGCDLKGRRFFSGSLWSDERDDFARRKPIIEGSAVEGDWDLISAAPDLLIRLRQARTALLLLLPEAQWMDGEAMLTDIDKAIAKAEGK